MARRRGLFLGIAAFAALACVAAVVGIACVPDLEKFTLPPEAAPPSEAFCGDGIIDLVAGEQCDPGPGGAVGCTPKCKIDCADGGFVDDKSKHCYFAITPPDAGLSYLNAKGGCEFYGAHVVTFVDRAELDALLASKDSRPNVAFWVGMQNVPSEGYETVNDEPGWAATCAGCYAEVNDGGFDRCGLAADASLGPCVTVDPATGAPWCAQQCGRAIGTLCEREPPGTRAQLCNGLQCIDLPETLGRKRYVFIETLTAAEEAAAFCRQFPKGSLVVFETRREREQLWHELKSLLPLAPPRAIWIGLTRPSVDAGLNEWQWDDGVNVLDGRPNPFGTNEPSRFPQASLRSYAELPGSGVDPQLARNIDRATLLAPTTLAYVCQFAP